MAFYTDPATGRRTEVSEPLVREPRAGGLGAIGWIVLLAVLIGGIMTYSNYYGFPSSDRPTSTVVSPATSPSDPNSSAVHPSPSPNPGP